MFPPVCLSRCCLSIYLLHSKTKQVCETSSIFELDKIKNEAILLDTLNFLISIFELNNVKNEAILRDFLTFPSWQQHQKGSKSARLPSKMEKLSAELTALCQSVLRFFPLHLSKVLHLPQTSEASSYEVLRVSRKIILANLKIRCSPPKKSAPWPPNISDEHVSCTAPATRNASLQILFKCPTTF